MALNVPGESSSSLLPSWKYHVFFNFTDGAENFTEHLYAELQRRGITVFRHDEISPLFFEEQVFKGIEDSLISIVFLSEDYGFSFWCLEELKKILEAGNELDRHVLPIFYGVDPIEVGGQFGSFGEALAKHRMRYNDSEGRLQVQQWRDALTEVACFPGFFRGRNDAHLIEDIEDAHLIEDIEDAHLIEDIEDAHLIEDIEDAHLIEDIEDAHLIEDIVESIRDRLLTSYHDNLLVGIEERMIQLNSLFEIGLDDDVCFVGIWGIGGIGKTTLAKFVYKMISSQFEISCFLANVRELSKKGVTCLQRKLISLLDMSSSMEIQDSEEGKEILKNIFRNKKVLLVLDDVNDINQLENLAEAPEWFGEGSRIIITTRDKHILISRGVHELYNANLLNKDESLKLLSSKAFRAENPPEGYVEMCESVVEYAGGLPLALQDLGSFLFGRSISEWKHALENTIQFVDNNTYIQTEHEHSEIARQEGTTRKDGTRNPTSRHGKTE